MIWTPHRDIILPRHLRRAQPRPRLASLFAPAYMVGGGYKCASADFDGSAAYLVRGGGLTGAVDGKQGLFSSWFRLDGGDGVSQHLLSSSDATGSGTTINRVSRQSSNILTVSMLNAAAATILDISTTATFLSGPTWRHILASWDLAVPGARHLYINDVSDISATIFTNDTIDYTLGDWTIGRRAWLAGFFDGCLAETVFHLGYLDLSVEANRRKFITASGKPVNLGDDGSLPFGAAPIVYQRRRVGEAVANFATNRGSGGNFSISGSLSAGSTSPSD